MLGITVAHLTSFSWHWKRAQLESASTPGYWLWVASLHGSFHLPLFFVAAGYLDTLYSPNLGAKDLATYLLVLLLPVGEILHITWSGWKHPGRWFLFCLLLCKVHMVLQRHFKVPKLLMLILVVFSSNILQYFVKWSQGATFGIPVVHWLTLVTMRFDGASWPKVDNGMIAYAVSAMWLPDLVTMLGRKGPRTVRKERMLGLLLWVLFCMWIIHNQSEELGKSSNGGARTIGFTNVEVYWNKGLSFGKLHPDASQDDQTVVPPFRFLIQLDMLFFTLPQIFLLCAAIAYLPLNLPDVYMNSSFGALLLLPVPLMSWFCKYTSMALFELNANVFARIFAFLCVYSVYYAVLSPIVQMFVGKAMMAATMSGTRLHQQLFPIDK
jgi:hypothetical protein